MRSAEDDMTRRRRRRRRSKVVHALWGQLPPHRPAEFLFGRSPRPRTPTFPDRSAREGFHVTSWICRTCILFLHADGWPRMCACI